MAAIMQRHNENPLPRTTPAKTGAGTRRRKAVTTNQKQPVAQEIDAPKKFGQSTRGRKAEAIKEFIPPTIKKYRTRKDYMGERWKHLVDEATPESMRSKKIDFEPTATAKEVIQKRVSKSARAKAPSVKAVKSVKVEEPSPEVTMKIVNNVTGTKDNNQPMAAEFAYNLMELCSKYMFVMKDAFNGEDGITEIDIHIKVKPTSSFTGKGCPV